MVLADACFNITHSSFKENFEDILNESKKLGVEHFFCPAAEKKDCLLYTSDAADE